MGKFTAPAFWQQTPPPQTGDMNNERYLSAKATLELPGAQAPQSVTIADGSIAPTYAALIIDTEGGAAADDLTTINTTISGTETLHNGMLLTLRATDASRVVTIKNSIAANGINTADGNDIVLSPDWELPLRLVGGRWYEVRGRSSAQAAAAQTDATTALGRTNPATTTARGIGRIATSDDLVDGSTITNGPAFLAAGLNTSVAAGAGKLPVANSSGHLSQGWLGSMLCNVRTIITTSGNFVMPLSGWLRVRAIGGGGAGGGAPIHGGLGGGTTSFGAYLSAIGGAGGAGCGRTSDYQSSGGSGGGAAGEVTEALVFLAAGTQVNVVIGAGGICSTVYNTMPTGVDAPTPSYTSQFSYSRGNPGAKGAGNGTTTGYDGTNGDHRNGVGGNGGRNGTGYGGGGGGAGNTNGAGGLGADGGGNGAVGNSSSTVSVQGGAGGNGAVILEYFNPAITS